MHPVGNRERLRLGPAAQALRRARMKTKLLKALVLCGLLLAVGSMTACDDDDWEDFFDEAGDFVDRIDRDGGCRGDCCGGWYDDCDDYHWYEFWYW